MDRIRDIQPHMSVNSASLIPPSLLMECLNRHGEYVFAAIVRGTTNVVFKRCIAARVLAEFYAIKVDRAVSIHSVEVQPKIFAFIC